VPISVPSLSRRPRSALGSGVPTALSRFDLVPVGLNPAPERGERLFERAAETGELVEVGRARPSGVELPLMRPSRSARRSVSVSTLCDIPSKRREGLGSGGPQRLARPAASEPSAHRSARRRRKALSTRRSYGGPATAGAGNSDIYDRYDIGIDHLHDIGHTTPANGRDRAGGLSVPTGDRWLFTARSSRP